MLPQKFTERMQLLPGLDFNAFLAALEAPAVRAFRVNTLHTTASILLPLLSFTPAPLPFLTDAYYAPQDKIGAHPAHHAGMLYMQDPSAMCSVAAAAPTSGLHVIDLCAAPGGKSTQLAAAIGSTGVLVSNEYVPSRCRILQGNIERLGIPNAIVSNLATDALAAYYGTRFDLVVADVPCSGEGMFRKYDCATEEWSPEAVLSCASRQREILENAAALTRPGGQLLYSTCTFSLEENEQNIDAFLTAHPDFSLCPVPAEIIAITADGIDFAGCTHSMRHCRRFYPHLSPGEGQFVALLQRSPQAPFVEGQRDAAQPLEKQEQALVQAFLKDALRTLPKMRLVRQREDIFLAPELPIPARGVFAPGVCVGTLIKGRIQPHHQFFSAYGKDFCRVLSLSHGDPRVEAYLHGEEIAAPELTGQTGFAAVLYEGAPLGGGKAVDGRLKNYYPKGLRNR